MGAGVTVIVASALGLVLCVAFDMVIYERILKSKSFFECILIGIFSISFFVNRPYVSYIFSSVTVNVSLKFTI